MWFNFIDLLLLLIVCLHQFQSTVQHESSNKGNEYLLVANKTAIYKFNELTLNSSLITHIPTDSKVKSFDYSFKDRLLFWISQLDSSINVNNIDNGKVTSFRCQTTSPESLAIDFITKKIYWIDIEPYRIEVADYDGSNNSLILILSNQIPKCLSLAPLDGLIFWNDNERNTISRISMNGLQSTRKTIINGTKTVALAVDHTVKKIFWSDVQSRRIRSADFNGQHQREILSSYTPTITLNNNYIYYSDLIDKLVYSLDPIDRSKRHELIKFDDNFVPHLQYFSHLNQPEKTSQCLINNGGCSNLCLLSSEFPFYSCACPTGIQLSDDKQTCKTFPDNFLLIAFKFNIKYISLDTDDFLPKPTKIKNQDKISSVDFDPLEQRVYWSDKNKIKSAFLNGTDEKLITECELEYERIKIDIKNRNIYLVKNLVKFTKEDETRSSNFSIEVVSLDGKFKKTLIDNLIDRPRALALDEDREFLYFSDWGRVPKIERVSLGSGERKLLVKSGIFWPNGIVIDRELNRLYWCDAKFYKIEYLDLDTYKTNLLIKFDGVSFLDLTLLGDFIYWSDTTKDQIGRVHKSTGISEIISNKNQKLGKIMGLNAITLKDRNSIHPDTTRSFNCSQLNLSQGSCACSDGYLLDSDNTTCLLGNNTCDLNNGGCEQNCYQLIGNYRKCSCYDGYVLEYDQQTCTEKKHDIPNFLPCPANENPCSHGCFLIDNGFHCKCPSDMYLHGDTKTCLPYSKSNDNYLKEPAAVDQPNSTTTQTSQSSTSTLTIVCLLIVSLSLVVILILKYGIKKKRKRNRLNYSKENILDNNKRLIDFGYSLSNVENSILYDRSVAGASSASNVEGNKQEKQALTNPPPSPFSQENETSLQFDFKFDHNNLRFVSGRESSTVNNSEPDLIDIDCERKTNDSYPMYVPPSTPVNCLPNPASLYCERNSTTDLKNETNVDTESLNSNNSNNNSSFFLNPPNSPSTSMGNLANFLKEF